ncbi:MAG: ATP-binding protein [Verrucomicrobiota bacterium]|nr:ATP-binding protein [Verrucomicrobiota bacterium]
MPEISPEFQAVIDTLEVMVISVDPSLNVSVINKAALEKFLKLDPATIDASSFLGQPLQNIIQDMAMLDRMNGPMQEILQAARSSYREEMSFHNSDQTYYLEIQGFPWVLNGQIIGVNLMISDLFYEKELQGQILQTEELFTFKEVLLGAANELNNLLTIIASYAMLILNREGLEPKMLDEMTKVSEQTHRAKGIVANLLMLAKKHEASIDRVDVNVQIQKVFEMRQYELSVNNLLMEFDLQSIPETAGDQYRVQQLILNLINHCMESIIATNMTGTVKVNTCMEGDLIKFTVSDNGPQFPEEDLPRLFDPFFSSQKSERKISMGLSICRRIVEEHYGKIKVANVYPRGAEFTILLPVQDVSNIDSSTPEEMVALNAAANKGSRTRYKKIMVVDDEEGIRIVLSELLEALGYEAIVSGDGRLALSQIIKDKPDAIISDMRMPHVNGKTLYKAVQKMNPKLAANMMFITGDVVRSDSSGFIKENNIPHLNKPFTLSDLETSLDHLASTEADRLNRVVT